MMTENMTKIWLIRHGHTDWNHYKRCLGKTDLPLSSKGIQAVSEIGRCIDISVCDLVFCSPALRSVQTAQILTRQNSIDYLVQSELQEIDFGLWEGVSWSDIITCRTSEWNTWKNNPEYSNPYNGETLHMAGTRISTFFSETVAAYNGKTIAMIGHGGTFNLLLCTLFQIPYDVIWSFKLQPASFSEIQILTNGPFLSVLNYKPNIPLNKIYFGNKDWQSMSCQDQIMINQYPILLEDYQ